MNDPMNIIWIDKERNVKEINLLKIIKDIPEDSTNPEVETFRTKLIKKLSDILEV